MNVRLLSYIRKSKYKTKDNVLRINDYIAFAINTAFCLCMIINEITGKSEFSLNFLLYAVLITSYCYVLFHYIYISQKKKSERLESLQNHHDYLKLSLWGLMLILAVIAAIIGICVIYGVSLSRYVYIWAIPMFLMCYAQGYYLKSVVLFGKNFYRSGEYIIHYGDIAKIETVKVYTNTARPISLVGIYDKAGISGMDKFFVEESAVLIEKIKGGTTSGHERPYHCGIGVG
jgi:hypothetical protein